MPLQGIPDFIFDKRHAPCRANANNAQNRHCSAALGSPLAAFPGKTFGDLFGSSEHGK
jgi:hypothetical protein